MNTACSLSEVGEKLPPAAACGVSLTSTRDAQSAHMLMCAAGGAMSVPNDHNATPAISTLAPPMLQPKRDAGVSRAMMVCDSEQHHQSVMQCQQSLTGYQVLSAATLLLTMNALVTAAIESIASYSRG